MHESNLVISADEKDTMQARHRLHATAPPRPGKPTKVEHKYKRIGAWAYLTAHDGPCAKLFGHCESESGIAPSTVSWTKSCCSSLPRGPARVLDRRQRLLP